ncbi:MAG: type I glyceraldehyde-3-phosphate dehydrogenase [Afipia sp.]|nr:type I glyceraldehyde-3-phosphate dehydrogenase [Afipia sp.]
MKTGINGMGRIGRLALRAGFGGLHRPENDPRRSNRLDIVHINEVKGGIDATAHLLEFDSIHGRWREEIGVHDGKSIGIADRRMSFSDAANPGDVDWGDRGCDVVLECTGKFLKPDQLQAYFDRGVKRVIVAAPVKDDAALNVVVGVNDKRYDPERHRLLTAASCTTNCLAPVVKVIHEAIGIRHGQITTIHDPTNTNVVVDAPHKDLRRARSVLNASLTDCVFEVTRETTVAEVNKLFEAAEKTVLAGILGIEHRPLVSADYTNDTRSAIVDAQSTMVTDGTLLKVYAWYDNEVGYACRMVDLANIVARAGL